MDAGRIALAIAATAAIAIAIVGSGSVAHGQSPSPVLEIPHLDCPVVIDGRLDENCYQQAARVPAFVVASHATTHHAPATEAMVFWNEEHLVFAFDAVDRRVRASRPGKRESDVDRQDRVEVFLWSGRAEDAYGCIEIGAMGAVHDYLARFYRRFDSTWSPGKWSHAVSWTPRGYRVELELPAETTLKLGLGLAPGARWRLGLFRADFTPGGHYGAPTWVTWVDARTPEADFHVAESFGEMVLR